MLQCASGVTDIIRHHATAKAVNHAGFHDGAGGSKNRILACPEECCPKLWAVAQAVADSQQKALVMTSRACGYLVMLALLRQMAEKSTKSKSAVPFQVATMEELAEFNHVSNATGQAAWWKLR